MQGGYDTAGWLTGMAHAKEATPLASVAYTLDDAGNRLTETAAGVPLAGTTTYTYDALDRLATAAYPDSSTTTYAAYDYANRLCWSDVDTAGTCTTPPREVTTFPK